jgi:hypothetical protein
VHSFEQSANIDGTATTKNKPTTTTNHNPTTNPTFVHHGQGRFNAMANVFHQHAHGTVSFLKDHVATSQIRHVQTGVVPVVAQTCLNGFVLSTPRTSERTSEERVKNE